jgi:hypothetical protein
MVVHKRSVDSLPKMDCTSQRTNGTNGPRPNCRFFIPLWASWPAKTGFTVDNFVDTLREAAYLLATCQRRQFWIGRTG